MASSIFTNGLSPPRRPTPRRASGSPDNAEEMIDLALHGFGVRDQLLGFRQHLLRGAVGRRGLVIELVEIAHRGARALRRRLRIIGDCAGGGGLLFDRGRHFNRIAAHIPDGGNDLPNR
jgi:hypothetical protein